MLSCTRDDALVPSAALDALLAGLAAKFPCALYDAVELAAKRGLGSYILMAPLLWSAMRSEGGSQGVVGQSIAPTEWARGIPLYALDKHTASGKRAITSFAQGNAAMVQALEPVPVARRNDVALMAAFYADAVPISRQFLWSQSHALEQLGFAADMGSAGCPLGASTAILDCVRANLSDLHRIRRAAFDSSSKFAINCTATRTVTPGHPSSGAR